MLSDTFQKLEKLQTRWLFSKAYKKLITYPNYDCKPVLESSVTQLYKKLKSPNLLTQFDPLTWVRSGDKKKTSLSILSVC